MTFQLERFAWAGPDRLEVSGTFAGLRHAPGDDPVLVVSGGDGSHHLTAVPGTLSGPPEDGRPWSAQFAWQEPPVAFENAELRFGRELLVRLPDPDEQGSGNSRLEVAGPEADPASGDAESALAEPPGTGGDGQARLAQPAASGPAERVRLEAELVAAREEIRELREDGERLSAELARAQEDLRSERERHAADADRFREGLAKVQASADQALREAQAELEAKEAALEEARRELQAATDTQGEALAAAQAETEDLRRRVAPLEGVRGAADEAAADIERLMSRLATIRDLLGDRAR